MKIFVAGGTGAIGGPLIAELLAKGHVLSCTDTFSRKSSGFSGTRHRTRYCRSGSNTDAVKAVVSRAHPEIVIEQLTALPRKLHP